MVAGPSPPLEWSLTDPSRSELMDPNGRFQDGLGCVLPRGKDRRPLDGRGIRISHKLLRTPGCLPGNPNICQMQEQPDSLHPDGQCYSPNLHQQEGRNSFPFTIPACQEAVDMVHGEEADHIPWKENTTADRESRVFLDRWDWKLNPDLFNLIQQMFGPLEIDLFASRISKQLPRYFSWRPDSDAEAIDAFKQAWKGNNYANPPWAIIPRVLSHVKMQRTSIVLIAPVWKSQVWYPVLLNLLVDYPCLLPTNDSTILQLHTVPLPVRGHQVQLAAWPISGDHVKKDSFLRKLQASSWHHGDLSPRATTTHSFSSGSAGVVNGAEIPFRDLCQM